jgi:hypothetical protein
MCPDMKTGTGGNGDGLALPASCLVLASVPDTVSRLTHFSLTIYLSGPGGTATVIFRTFTRNTSPSRIVPEAGEAGKGKETFRLRSVRLRFVGNRTHLSC